MLRIGNHVNEAVTQAEARIEKDIIYEDITVSMKQLHRRTPELKIIFNIINDLFCRERNVK